MRLIHLLALLPLALALFDDDPELSLTQRNAAVIDIRGVYLLQEATGDAADRCPTNITHTTWRRIADGSIGLPHNTIIQDGVRCESTRDERSLRFYQGTDYDDSLAPLNDDVDPLPEEFVTVMSISGFNINARLAIRDAGGRYLMGYEDTIRVCDAMNRFGRGTTAFLMRPVATTIKIKNLATTLTPGLKYLLMVPRFRRTYCLYSSDVNGPDDAFRPLPTEEPFPSPTLEPAPSPMDPSDPSFPDESPGDVEPSATPQSVQDDGVCFPADALVSLKDGRSKRMDELLTGEAVHVGQGSFSTVFAFTHDDRFVRREFVKLTTDRRSITATEGHFIYINGAVARIETAGIGDRLTLANGEQDVVKQISRVQKTGLYNPQTIHGDIVVDGVMATTYTKTVEPRLAHAVLTPFRALFDLVGVDLLTRFVPDLRSLWLR